MTTYEIAALNFLKFACKHFAYLLLLAGKGKNFSVKFAKSLSPVFIISGDEASGFYFLR